MVKFCAKVIGEFRQRNVREEILNSLLDFLDIGDYYGYF